MGDEKSAEVSACTKAAELEAVSIRENDEVDGIDVDIAAAAVLAGSSLKGSSRSPQQQQQQQQSPKTDAAQSGKEDETEREYYFGIGSWHPPGLQVLRDARVFTFLLCLFSTVEGALINGFAAVVLSTIERRYRLSSTATGSLASITDAAILVSVIFVSYFGGRGHKPRWLGISLIVQAIGAFVFILPQFLLGRYEVGASGFLEMEACEDGNLFSDCNSANNAALAFFLIGNIIMGIAAAPLFTIGTAYLDEIVHPKYVSIHLGFFYMTAVVGPALGYIFGGLFLSVYVDSWQDTHLEPSDPGWVGAWWLCFLTGGIMSLIIAVPYFFFPRLLPNSKAIRALREEEMAEKGVVAKSDSDDSDGLTHFQTVVKRFPLEFKKVVTNPSWIFITAAVSVAGITISGFASFGVKYVENQFALPASSASFIVGVRTIPTGGAGVVASGLIIYFLKVKGRRVPLMGLVVSILASVTLFAFLIHCPTSDLAGVLVPYADGTNNRPDTSSLHPNCTAGCNCTSSVYEPVCGADNVVYFSPCQAGCPANPNGTDYEQCSCIADQLYAANTSQLYSDLLLYNSSASAGVCDRGCGGGKLQLYLTISAFTLFLVFMLQVPNIIVTIRCVAENQRTLALGIQSCILRLVGFVPGPLLFGAVFDSTCLFWQRDCGRRGNCWVYDNTSLSTRAVVLAVVAMVGYIVFIFLCWVVYPRQPATSKEKDGIPLESVEGTADEGETGGIEQNQTQSSECMNTEVDQPRVD